MAFNQFPLPLPQPYESPYTLPEASIPHHGGSTLSGETDERNVVMQQGLAIQEPGGIPAHPHLISMRHSREYSCSSPASIDLSSYRNNLLSTLNSERWGHHRTVQNMEQELAYYKQEIDELKRGCDSWAHAWSNCNAELLNCSVELVRSETDRMSLLRELIALRALQETQQALLQERDETKNRLQLNMSSAKDRQINVLRRRLSRRHSPCSTRASSAERLSCEILGLNIGNRERQGGADGTNSS